MLIENFQYPGALRFFEEISAIPRGSYHEEKIADYLVDFAEKRGLEVYRDTLGNVLINCPATEGFEDRPLVLLQGHTDMVCEKNANVEHDFLKDPLLLYVQDGWVRAKGTTLGADNGVAVATMLAILDGEHEGHPALQCLFTVSEEVGLDGAKAFDYSRIVARRMINMDSADDSTIIVGCAGGERAELTLPVHREVHGGITCRLRIGGLAGGHSGEDVDRGRANANKLLGRILWALCVKDESLRLISYEGGSKDNAIPREAEAVLSLSDFEGAQEAMARVVADIKGELGRDDGGAFFALEPIEAEEMPMDRESTLRAILMAYTIPIGVFARSPELTGLVEYSRNLGVLSNDKTTVKAVLSSRSAKVSQIDASVAELDAFALLLGGEARYSGRYPGWDFVEESALREEYAAMYRDLFGRELRMEVIHAGLECGIIKESIPDMDMLSCGPIILNLHSPDEALNIASFERFLHLIHKVLSR